MPRRRVAGPAGLRPSRRVAQVGGSIVDHPRAAGSVLLELVLLVLVVVAGLAQRAASGTPRAMATDPPRVGVCLRQEVDGVEPAPCTERHVLQVTRSWPVWLWDGEGGDRNAALGMCELAATKFLGSAARFQDWGPIPLPTSSVLTSGPGTGDHPWGWQACAVTVQSGPGGTVGDDALSGSLFGATTMSARPAELRACFDVVELGWSPARCSRPHSGEFLAERLVPLGSGPLSARSRNELLDSCRVAAAWIVGRDVADDHRVRITVRDGLSGDPSTPAVASSTGRAPSPRTITVRCAIEGSADRQLGGSVIGLGDQPLPVR